MNTSSYISLYSKSLGWLQIKAGFLRLLGWNNQGETHWSSYKGKWTMGVWR